MGDYYEGNIPGLYGFTEGIKASYLQPTLEQALTKAILDNQILKPKAQYAEQITQADLAKAIAESNLTGEQAKWFAPTARSNINLQGAQANNFNTEAKYKPLDIALRAAASAKSGSRFGDAYQFNRALQTMSPDQRNAYISMHPDDYQSMLDTLGNKAVQDQENKPQQLVDSLLRQYYPEYNKINSEIPQQNNVAGISPNGQQKSAWSTNEQQREYTTNAFKLAANRKNTPASLNDRAANTMAFENTLFSKEAMDDMVPKINEATEYAGLKGRTQKYQDQWLNEHPNAMQSYDWYNSTFKTFITNGLKYMEKMGATDQQREEAAKILNSVNDITSDPKRAKSAINNFMHTLQNFGTGIINAAEPIHKGVYRKLNNSPEYKGNYLDYKPSVQNNQSAISMQSPDGRVFNIPAEQVDAALAKGMKRVS